MKLLEKMKVHVFIPCFVDQLFPQTAVNMIRILRKLGCEIIYNQEQTCCGQPAFNAGYWDDCRSVANKFVKDFERAEYIVTPSGSCAGFVRNYYNKLYSSDSKYRKNLPGARLYELTEFLTQILRVDEMGAVLKGVATYHDACGALRECNIKDAPRQLLSKVAGLQLLETEDCEVCCGFGGTFAVKFEAISTGMCEQKVLNALQTGAEYLISTDMSCLMHLDGYIRKHGYRLKILHVADVLASGW